MTLAEYLRMRRTVETASPVLVAQAKELAEQVKTRNRELTTVDRMWDELIKLAEENERLTKSQCSDEPSGRMD